MGLVANTAKKIAFWTYPRTSWQWDVLCVLILVFIFLTPKSWFENTEYRRSHMAQMTIVLAADVIGNQSDRATIDRQARAVAGRAEAEANAVRGRREHAGKWIDYE